MTRSKAAILLDIPFSFRLGWQGSFNHPIAQAIKREKQLVHATERALTLLREALVNQTDENRFSIQASLKSVDHLLDVNEALQAKFVEEIRRVTPDFNQRGPLLHRLYNSPYKPQFFAAKALPKVIQAIKDPAKKAAAQRIWLINTDNSLGKVF